MEKVNLNKKDLHTAALDGDVETIEKLIAEGVNVNVEDRVGFTALHEAVLAKKIKSVRALIKVGADVNAKDHGKCTALHYASMSEDGIAIELIENGAKINVRSICGNTPLHEAVIMVKEKNVKALMERGADVNIENNMGQTARDIAKIKKLKKIVEIIDRLSAC